MGAQKPKPENGPSCRESHKMRSLELDNLGAVGGRLLLQRMGVIEAGASVEYSVGLRSFHPVHGLIF